MSDKPFTSLSWGGGQQSTAILVASTLGLTINGYTFPPIDLAVFANTGSESRRTYESIEKAKAWAEKRGTRVEIVEAAKLRRGRDRGANSLGDLIVERHTGGPDAPTSVSQIPAFTKNADGSKGRLMKACSVDFKTRPLTSAMLRASKADGKADRVLVLMGYGIEEVHRIRQNIRHAKGWRNDFPLINAKMNRHATREVCMDHLGFIPPPSACVFCPFRGVSGWRELRDNSPKDFSEVVRVDEAIRHDPTGRLDAPVFLSQHLVPVEEAIERDDKQLTLFGGQCDDGGCWT